jgi:hypothetical protein
MRNNKTKHTFANTFEKFVNIVGDDTNEIQKLYFHRNKFVQIFFKAKEGLETSSCSTNVCLASFVTAYGRLELYETLDKLGFRVLYFDTDSIIYIHVNDMFNIDIGTYLGEFTSEVPTYISIYVSLGPKNYGFETDEGSQHITIKGISLNYLTSLKIDFEQMREIIQNDQAKNIMVEQLVFKREKGQWSVSTHKFEKKYRLVYDKRRTFLNCPEKAKDFNFNYFDEYSTLPFGFNACV